MRRDKPESHILYSKKSFIQLNIKSCNYKGEIMESGPGHIITNTNNQLTDIALLFDVQHNRNMIIT